MTDRLLSDPPADLDALQETVAEISAPTYDEAEAKLMGTVRAFARLSPRTLSDERWQELRQLSQEVDAAADRLLAQVKRRNAGDWSNDE